MKKIKSKLWALVAVVAMVVICGFGLLDKADWTMADRWYQEPQASGGDIVLVEIDQATLEAYGPFKDWDRTIMADAINAPMISMMISSIVSVSAKCPESTVPSGNMNFCIFKPKIPSIKNS